MPPTTEKLLYLVNLIGVLELELLFNKHIKLEM
jgi:hypothetical protein